jgi:hypothetical protein
MYFTVICLSTGCASIISGREADIAIKTNPSQAQVAIQNEKGDTVATSTTPAKISLKRSNGMFRKAPRYAAVIEKPGYETSQVDIKPKVNPWILGNVVFGGVIGLAADSATGAIWRYTPDEINQTLVPLSDEYLSEAQSPAEAVSPASFTTN